ncbi:MAG: hypothetical protein NCW75_14630 [Phycisphaera sp.]|nr:MAG: hypothetical protein NCW75_14630 [Phycisphaera sp.]
MAEAMTWAMLLARWTEFARSAVALPTEGAGGRWRESVPAIIGLQAIAMALGDLDGHELDEDRSLAIDTASVGIDRHARTLAKVWDDEPWPDELHELLEDARRALADAGASGLEWCVDAEQGSLEHPAELAGLLEAMGFAGDLYLAAPGQVLSGSCPCAFLHEPGGGAPHEAVIEAVGGFLAANGIGSGDIRRGPPRQAYRQFDFAQGGPVRDLVAWMGGDPRAGQPLLVPVVLGGQAQSVALPQRRGKPADPPPLEFEADASEEANAEE